MKPRILALLALLLVSGCGPFASTFATWEGEAELAKAKQTKQIQIEDARGQADSAELLAKAEIERLTAKAKGQLEQAKLLSQAEVERAKGVAEANRIIGKSLHGNEAYLRYLWISNLEKVDNKGTVIYVPTEAGLPLLEAGRVGAAQ